MTVVRSLNKLNSDVTGLQTNKFNSDSVNGLIRNTAGLEVSVNEISLTGFSPQTQTLTLLPSGTWYVGFDLFTKELIALPRLGHQGWVCVGQCTTDTTTVTAIKQIEPQLPKCKIPRTVGKILNGEDTKVLVMGSSLTAGTETHNWAGMLLNPSSSEADYRLPSNVTVQHVGLGGSPNYYQLAQLGYVGSFYGNDYTDSGYPTAFGSKLPPSAKGRLLQGVDLVIITVLANGGDYRLQTIEANVREIRKQGVEVIICTDNPQGAPFSSFDAITDSLLYVDGATVMSVADNYGIALADTAAYVTEAHLRYPDAADNIYADTIHMDGRVPAGRVGKPDSGHEVWARAIRSVIPIDYKVVVNPTTSYDFTDNIDGAVSYGDALLTHDAGRLKVEKASAINGQWGVSFMIQDLLNGDTVDVAYTKTAAAGATNTPLVGLKDGASGWASVSISIPEGVGTVTLTATRDTSVAGNESVLFFAHQDDAPQGTGMFLDDITITVNSSITGTSVLSIEDVEFVGSPLPDPRTVTDLRTPGSAFVILPKDEFYTATNSTGKGTLAASPDGVNSFARRLHPDTDPNEDNLILTVGDKAALSAVGVVGMFLVHRPKTGDPAIAAEIYTNNVLVKTINITPAQFREQVLSILTPTEHDNNTTDIENHTVDIRVTSGTLRVCALVASTFDLDYVIPENISYVGTWTDKIVGGSPNMLGYATDTADDYAVLTCPQESKRVAFICSGKPNSKLVDTWSGIESSIDTATVGVNHVYSQGNHNGRGQTHYIKLKETVVGGGDATNGYGLHVGGAVLVNDR